MGKRILDDADTKRYEAMVAALIRHKRHALGLSQDTMALNMGTTAKAYKDLETNRVHIGVSQLLKLCPVLKITIAELLDQAEERLRRGLPPPKTPLKVTCRPIVEQTDPAVRSTSSWIPVGIVAKEADIQWLGEIKQLSERTSYVSNPDQLRRGTDPRDSEVSSELCEAHED